MAIQALKPIPNKLNLPFGLCLWGVANQETIDLAKQCNFSVEQDEKYTNFYPNENADFSTLLGEPKPVKYLDGFSPNLNKYMHVGHLANLIVAKSLVSLGIAENTISLLGDLVYSDEVSHEDAFNKLMYWCKEFGYKIDKIYRASQMKLDNSILENGTGDYEGTKIFNITEIDKLVGIKKDGTTTYFYQDVAFATLLKDEVMYLTGHEQSHHFNLLKKLFPNNTHLTLGLVKVKGGKMSTRLGNVIYLEDLINELLPKFNDDLKLVYNVVAGYMISSRKEKDRVFDLDTISNIDQSFGLYISYTMARLKSAGLKINPIEKFSDPELTYSVISCKKTVSPHVLFERLVDLCKKVNQLYVTHRIVDNPENQKMFSVLLDDLALGMKKLGLFEIEKV